LAYIITMLTVSPVFPLSSTFEPVNRFSRNLVWT